MAIKIRKGDIVRVIGGKDKGREGKVLSVIPKTQRLIVDSVNIRKKHVRSKRAGEKGQIVESPGSLAISNVSLLCPNCKKSIRIGYKVSDEGTKSRWCRKCNTAVQTA